jgi:hypothetical protein
VTIFGSIFAVLLLLAPFDFAAAYIYSVNCYDTTLGTSGFYIIKTKFIDLDNKVISREITTSQEGDIINIKPIEIALPRDTILLSIIMNNCYCKNTRPGNYDCLISILNKLSRNIILHINIPGQMITGIMPDIDGLIYLKGILRENDNYSEIDGIYELGDNFNLNKIRNIPSDYFPNSLIINSTGEMARKIKDNIYYDVFQGNYYIMKTNDTGILIDTLRLENFESRNMIFSLVDTILYIFSLNYEVHLPGENYKGYHQDWIEANVRKYNSNTFALIDSIPLPDYPEGDFIGGSYGVGDIVGPYIVYYYGEEGNLELLYPAMLFIFDTRTNEASWLRVGWR